jgi:hypothetical protein
MKIEDSDFRRLVGVWKTTGNIKAGNGHIKLIGTDSYELILDGHCILHKADVKMGNENSETFEIIRLDNSTGKATMQYFNAKGEEGRMQSSIIKNELKIEGSALMFKGTIDDGNTKISGQWYTKSRNEEWTGFMDLTLEKQ